MKSKKQINQPNRVTIFQTKSIMKKAYYLFSVLLICATFNSFAQKAYIPNTDDNTVSVLDLNTNSVTATLPVGSSPYGVSVTPDGKKVYISNYGDNTVSVINSADNTISSITTGVGNGPTGLCVTPDGKAVYIVNQNDNTVSVIKTLDNSIITTIPVGQSPYGISVSPNNNSVYVSNQTDNTVSVINTSTNTVVATVFVGYLPTGISVTPDASKVYVVNQYDGTVSVINTSNNLVSATITVGSNPYCACFSPNGGTAYVTNWNDNTVSVINTTTNTVLTTFLVGTSPFGVNVSPDGSKIYTSNHDDGTINVNNSSDNSFVSTIPAGNSPSGFGNFIINSLAVGCISAPAPPTITGPNSICGLTSANYVASSPVAASSYAWTAPAGLTITHGQGTSAITVSIPGGTIGTTFTVTASNACGTSSAANYIVTKKPQPAAAINGPVSLCGANTAAYNVAPVFGATSYNWLLPAGITMATGAGSNSITVNVASNFVTGGITVNAINGCGYVTGPTLTVYGKVPNAPNTLTGPTNICGLTTAAYSISAAGGATGYFWTVPSGMTITGAGQGTSSIRVSISGFTSGNITAAGTNGCGTGAARSLALTTATTQPLAITGSTLTCGLTSANYSIAAVTGATGYTWTVPAGANIYSGQNTTAMVMTFTSPLSGNIGVSATNGCTTSLVRTLTVSKLEPIPSIITGPATGLCGLGTATYSIAPVAGATGYTWAVPTGMSITSPQGTTSITVNSATTATTGFVKVSAQNNCGSSGQKSLTVTCAESISMESQAIADKMFSELYPNPTTNEFTIEVTSEVDNALVVDVYDVLGNLLKHEIHQLNGGRSKMKTNITSFNEGIYFARVLDKDNNILYTQKIIKN